MYFCLSQKHCLQVISVLGFPEMLLLKHFLSFKFPKHCFISNFGHLFLPFSKTLVYKQLLFDIFPNHCLNANFLNLKSPNLPFFHKSIVWMPTFSIWNHQIYHYFSISLTECQLFKSEITKFTIFFTFVWVPTFWISNQQISHFSLYSLTECQLFESEITKFTIFS